jgi:signal recognition particle subunit SRP68
MQRAQLYLRETRSVLSTLDTSVNSATTSFYQITANDCNSLDDEIASASAVLKKDWFAFNGGSPSVDNQSYKKPLFFDIALNYV